MVIYVNYSTKKKKSDQKAIKNDQITQNQDVKQEKERESSPITLLIILQKLNVYANDKKTYIICRIYTSSISINLDPTRMDQDQDQDSRLLLL